MSEDEREPPYLYPDYVGTRLRAPAKPPVQLPNGFHDFPAPLFPRSLAELDHDLTRRHSGHPIVQSIPEQSGRERLVSRFDPETTVPEWALAYRWDIVLRGRAATPFENER